MRLELKKKIEQRERAFKRIVGLLNTALQLNRSIEELDPDTPLFGSGLALDSVDTVEIVVALESQFGISLDESESIAALRTINSLVEVVLNSEQSEF